MKKIFVLMALSAFSVLSADRFMTRCCDSGYGNGNWGFFGFGQNSCCCDDQWGWDGYSNGYGYSMNWDNSGPQQWVQGGPQWNQGGPQWNQGGGQWNQGGQWGQAGGFQRVGDRFQASDQEIAKRVHDALNSGRKFQELVFRVDNGVVTVRGPVESAEHRNEAEEAIRKIDGVRHVNIQIAMIGRPPADANADTRSASSARTDSKFANDFAATEQDRQINNRIRDKLNGGWFSKGYDALILRTNNGIVVVTGMVDSQDEANKLNDQLRGIEGVRKVNVQVAVKKK